MRKPIIILFFLYLLCTAMTCGVEYFPLINFVNNSDERVYMQISEEYPDTFISKGIGHDTWDMFPHTSFYLNDYLISRDDLFKKITYLQIMVCNEKLNLNLPNDTLRKYHNKIVLKRYQLTKHELDSMNWTLVYP